MTNSTNVSVEVVDSIVEELVGWLLLTTDAYADGDELAGNFEDLADIIRDIPSNIEVPEDIWSV